MKMKLRLVGGMMLIAVTLMLGSCVSDSDSSGLEYMPDMYRSPAIEPYVDYGEVKGRENKDLKMTQSALTPPNGTVPYYGTNNEDVSVMLPWNILPNIAFKQTHGLKGVEFTTEDTYNTLAAGLTENPLAMSFATEKNEDGEVSATNVTLNNGKKLYEANCMHCHGEKGDGKGQMMVNGTFTGVPNYGDKKDLSNGQLFYSIYYGKGAMGSHASIVNKKEIWSLVHYVRKFQNPDYDKEAKEAAIAMASGATMKAAEVEQMDWNHVNIEEARGHHMGLHVKYKSGSSAIDMEASIGDLKHVLEFMNANPDVKIALDGHTDSSGDADLNVKLSKERADAVKSWLVHEGIAANRIDTHGFGSTYLIMNEDGSENHDGSRRTELIIK